MDQETTMLAPNAGAVDLLTQLQTYLALSTLHLCSSPVPTDPATVLADLTAIEATYTGYAAKTLTAFTGPYLESPGVASILSALQDFSPTGSTIGNTINGGWVQTAGGVLIATFNLATPVGLNATTDVLPLVVEIRFPGVGVVHQLD